MTAAIAAQAEPKLDVPYVPTPHPVVAAMLDMAGAGAGDYVIDLGSGDGRIPIEAARRGARAFGVDINPVRVREANENARIAGVEDRVRFRRQDLFDTPIREASVLTMYLLPRVNMELRPRVLTELRPATRVVSHAFHMGDWEADEIREVEHATIYLWIVPAPVGGEWALSLADGRTLPLELEQRFQQVSGTLGGRPLRDLRLRGTELSFTANLGRGNQRFHGIWDGAVIAPAPDSPADAATGWQARRIS
jgi:SAM-dependent methyltransferase